MLKHIQKRLTIFAEETVMIIRHQQKPFFYNLTHSMRNQSVSFHFSQSDSTSFFSSLDWLSCERINWTFTSCLILILNHVSQSLIENYTLVNIRFHHHSIHSRIQSFCASFLKPVLLQNLLVIFIVAGLEAFELLLISVKAFSFGNYLLQQHTYSHSRRKSVRINDNVWADTGFRKRHFLLRPQRRHDTFLTVSTGELVSHNRISVYLLSHDHKLLILFLLLRREINSFYLTRLFFLIVFLFDLLCGFIEIFKVLLTRFYIRRGLDYAVRIDLTYLILVVLVYVYIFIICLLLL